MTGRRIASYWAVGEQHRAGQQVGPPTRRLATEAAKARLRWARAHIRGRTHRASACAGSEPVHGPPATRFAFDGQGTGGHHIKGPTIGRAPHARGRVDSLLLGGGLPSELTSEESPAVPRRVATSIKLCGGRRVSDPPPPARARPRSTVAVVGPSQIEMGQGPCRRSPGVSRHTRWWPGRCHRPDTYLLGSNRPH